MSAWHLALIAEALGGALDMACLDAVAYYWEPTDPPDQLRARFIQVGPQE